MNEMTLLPLGQGGSPQYHCVFLKLDHIASNTIVADGSSESLLYVTCTDARSALAPQLSGGTRVRHWQSG